MMKNRLKRHTLSILPFLLAGVGASQAYADWSGDKLHRGYNQRFGDFPPIDIDQQLSKQAGEENAENVNTRQSETVVPENSQPIYNAATPGNQSVQYPAQNYGSQYYQQPSYGGYNTNSYPYGGQRHNRGSGFSGPWNNSGSSFTGPWNNRGSGFSGPWNNRGSSFSGPWNNNGSSFSMPWGNNNGSGFSPWGKK